MRVARLDTASRDAVAELQPPGWSSVVAAFDFYFATSFCRPLGAFENDKLVAVVCAITFGKSAWISHMIVRPSHRRRGVGSALMEHALTNALAPSVEAVSLIATEEGRPLYERFGFTYEHSYDFYGGERLIDLDLVPTCFVREATEQDAGVILAIDKHISGEQRSCLLEPHLKNGWVSGCSGEVTGFYLPTLGQGLIESTDHDAGIALLARRMRDHKECVVPSANQTARSFLVGIGCTRTRQATRMTLRGRVGWQPRHVYSRIGGNLG